MLSIRDPEKMDAEADSQSADGPGSFITASTTPPLARRLADLVLHTSVPIKAQVLFAVVVVGSCLKASVAVPEMFLSVKFKLFDKSLMKYSWFWTSLWLFTTISITSALYCALAVRDMLRHLSRIAVGHVVWYSVTAMIEMLRTRVGECSMEGLLTARACVRGGNENGCDISEHTFLFSYCIFVVTEEASNVRMEVWSQYNGALEDEKKVLLESEEEGLLPNIHHTATLCLVEALRILALFSLLVWSGMCLSTSLYFHTFTEKLLGLLISVVFWYVTYGLLYGKPYLPPRPEDGILHPTKETTISTSELEVSS